MAVADHGSFRAAARACHVSQPGLSVQLQQLEEHLGVRLFERDRRRVLVTEAGQELLRQAREVLGGSETLRDTARGLGRPLAGRLRLGVIPTVAPYLLPRVLPRVRRRHRELRLQLREARTEELTDALGRGELDLLLLALEAPLAGLETQALFRDRFVLALPRDHPLASRKRVGENDLAGQEVLLLDDGHCLRDQALSWCSRAGAGELGDFRASSLGTLVQMIAGGLGVTLLPELALAVEGRGREITTVGFRRPEPFRTIGLAWRPSSPRIEEFRLLAPLLGGEGA